MITLTSAIVVILIVLGINWLDMMLDYKSYSFGKFMEDNEWRLWPVIGCTLGMIVVLVGVTLI